MLTIVEGPDGAGKTTLIKSWDADFTHHGAYLDETSIARHYMTSLLPAYDTSAHVVLDRSWLAEPIYGHAFRGGADRVGVASARMLERVALGLEAVVVMCLPPYESCRRAWASRREREYLDDERALHAVYDGYATLLTEMRSKRHALNVVEYDYTTMRIPDPRELIGRSPANEGPGAGRFASDVALLVGDRANADDARPPFVSFNAGGCSVWLALQLEAAGVSERQLYWVNAYDVNGRAVDPGFVDRLAPRTIVALGANAARWCIDASLTHDQVPHPQFWKRFHHGEPYALPELLKRRLA